MLRILDVYDQGVFSKREVMRIAKMRGSTFDAAYARLVELAATVDDETREAIFQAIA